MTARIHHQVSTADPVVRFEDDEWERFLTVRGERAFFVGGRCDTCTFMFERKLGETISPTVVAERLAVGANLLNDDLVDAAGTLLPSGDYAVMEMSIEPTLIGPCDPDDYFSHESVDLFGMPPHSGVPEYPRTRYWRVETRDLPVATAAPAAPVIAPDFKFKHFFHFVIPLQPPHSLDPERVDHYRQQLENERTPAALGISVLDVRAPAITPWDKRDDTNYQYGQHWCLATYVLDGHHKIQAAAESHRQVRLLAFLARDASVATEREIDALVHLLADG